MKSNFKKILTFLISAIMLVSVIVSSTAAIDLASFADYSATHWANTAMSDAIDNKLLFGYEDNTIRPDSEITRAEMATVINRAFGATVAANISHFPDVTNDDWFFNEVEKAVQMQTFNGTQSGFEPARPIFREEAMAVIARALVLEDGDPSVLNKYPDKDKFSDWALGSAAALVSRAYINGTDQGLAEPRSYVTRAQFAQIMYNIFSDYILESGTYTVNAERSLMINKPNVNLRNCTINGDLVLGDGVGEGYVYLSNVKVNGRILIRGGDKITLKNVTTKEGIVVKNLNGTVNFQNYENELVFKNNIKYTEVTFLKKTPIIPIFPSTPDTYTVTFYDYDGSVFDQQVVEEGYNATNPGRATNYRDLRYVYTFDTWDTNYTNVKSDLEIRPIYTKTDRLYTIHLEYDSDVKPVGNTELTASVQVKYDDKIADALSGITEFAKDKHTFKGWYYSGTLIKDQLYSDIDPEGTGTIVLKDEWGAIEVKIEYYIPDGNGGYVMFGEPFKFGANIGDTVNALDYNIPVDGYEYDPNAAGNVLVGTVEEGKELILKVYLRETYTVTFYGWNGIAYEVIGSPIKNISVGTTVSESDFPVYTENMPGYETGPDTYTVDITAINPTLYAEKYVHQVGFTWGYDNGTEVVEFNEQTAVNSNIDVYPYFKVAKVEIHADKFSHVQGGNFQLSVYYNKDTRIADNFKDLLSTNETAIKLALEQIGAENKALEKLSAYGLVDTSGNILNQEQRIKIVDVIGDENLDKFVHDNAKNNVDDTVIRDFLDNYTTFHTEAEAREFIRGLIDNMDSDDLKPAIKEFLAADASLLETEIYNYIMAQYNEGNYDAINRLLKTENGLYSADMMAPYDVVTATVINAIKNDPTISAKAIDSIADAIASGEYLSDDDVANIIFGNKTELAAKLKAMSNSDINTLLGLTNGLYSDDMLITHAQVKTLVETAMTDDNVKAAVVAELLKDESYVREVLGKDDILAELVMEYLNGLVQQCVGTDGWTPINSFIETLTGTDPHINNNLVWATAEAGIKGQIEGLAGQDKTNAIDAVVEKINSGDIDVNDLADEVATADLLTQMDSLYNAKNYAGLNKLLGVSNGVFSDDMILDRGKLIDNMVNGITEDDVKAIVANIRSDSDFIKGLFNDTLLANVIEGYIDTQYNAGKYSEINTLLGIENGLYSANMPIDADTLTDAIADAAATAIASGSGSADILNSVVDMVCSDKAMLDWAIDEVVHDMYSDDNIRVHIIDAIMNYLSGDEDKKEEIITSVVDVIFKSTIDEFVRELREEEQFTVYDDFTAEIANAVYNKYSSTSLEEFIKDASLPAYFDKVLSNEAIMDIAQKMYNEAMGDYLTALKKAHDDYYDKGEPQKVNTYVTVKINPVTELINPLYDEFRRILDEKINEKQYHKDNVYTMTLIDYLSPSTLLNGSDADATEEFSGYTIPTVDEMYAIMYNIAVLADDAGSWYVDNVPQGEVEAVVDSLENKILEYLNCIIGFINEYYEQGTLPKIEDLPDDKLTDLLEDLGIQGIVDRQAKIQAIINRITTNQKFNNAIEKFYNSKFNKPLTGEDYEKAKKLLDIVFKNDEWNVDRVFDEILSVYASDYKVNDNTYEITYGANKVTLIREMIK